MTQERTRAIGWARDILSRTFYVLNTQTTGLNNAEPVEIAIAEDSGYLYMDTLIKPQNAIESGATAIHGITAETVANAPDFTKVYPALALLDGVDVVTYGGKYHREVIEQTCVKRGLPAFHPRWHDLMHIYSAFYGDWWAARNIFVPQKLEAACTRMDVGITGKRASNKAAMILRLIDALARAEA